MLGVEFDEKIMWKEKPTGALRKLQTQWRFGVFIGVKRRSGEVILTTDKGEIKKVRSVRRVPLQERWQEANLAWVQHVPWHLGAGDPLAEGTGTPFDVKASPGVKMRPEILKKSS